MTQHQPSDEPWTAGTDLSGHAHRHLQTYIQPTAEKEIVTLHQVHRLTDLQLNTFHGTTAEAIPAGTLYQSDVVSI